MSTKRKDVDTLKAQVEKPEQRKEEKPKRKKRKPLVKGVKKKKGKSPYATKVSYSTHDGHKLTAKEAKFIDLYIETGNQRQSVIDAGYTTQAPGQYAQTLLSKDYIASEIDYRLKKLEDEKICSAEEILEFYSKVMRGEEKDQFGLDVSMADRIRAANELAKRKIDIVNKVQGGKDTAEVRIKLEWEGIADGEEESESES